MSLFVAREGFATVDAKGLAVRVHAGDIAEEGNWLLSRAPSLFKPLEIAFPAPAPAASADADSAPKRSARKHAA